MLTLVAQSFGHGPAEPLRVAVVSNDRFVRAGLVAMLEAFDDLHIVADLEVDQHLTSRIRLLAPDVVLSDVPIDTGVPTVILVSDTLNSEDASGVLMRSATAEQIEAALRAVAEGLTVRDGSMRMRHPQELTESLTHRELEVLQLLAEGLTNKEIAQRLAISEHTVKFHVNAILTKLGAETRTEAVVQAARLGILIL